ncbi:hypothetical protein D3C80_1440840 [compost metagenome]
MSAAATVAVIIVVMIVIARVTDRWSQRNTHRMILVKVNVRNVLVLCHVVQVGLSLTDLSSSATDLARWLN